MAKSPVAQPDYEVHHYGRLGGSEIRAIYHDRPSELVATFPNKAACMTAWDQLIDAIQN